MRILLITHYYAPEYGAPQRRWGMLTRAFVAAGHRVTVLAPTPHYPSGRPTLAHARRYAPGTVQRGPGGETVVRTAFLPHHGDIFTRTVDHATSAGSSVLRAAVRFHAREHRPDVIIATAPAMESLLAGRILAGLWRVPLVAEMRDAWPDLVTHVGPVAAAAHTARRTPGLRRAAVRAVISAVKRQAHESVSNWQRGADRVVTTTARFAAILADRGVHSPVVVRNGTDLDRVVWRRPHPVDDHPELRVLYLGTMGRSQGLEVAVEAAARLRRMGVSVRVRLVGHGVAAPRLKELARQLEAPVEVLPRVPYSQVGQHYDWADTVLVSLRPWEPFAWTVPSKLYELLATGRHISALLAGEAADVVREAGAGDLVPPGDDVALATLWKELAEDRSRLDIGPGGRAWAGQHAHDPILARRYLELLEGVVAGATPGAGAAGAGVAGAGAAGAGASGAAGSS